MCVCMHVCATLNVKPNWLAEEKGETVSRGSQLNPSWPTTLTGMLTHYRSQGKSISSEAASEASFALVYRSVLEGNQPEGISYLKGCYLIL